MLMPHLAWLALDADPARRAATWRRLLDAALTEQQLDAIRQSLQQQRAWSRDDLRAMVDAKTSRFAGNAPHIGPQRGTSEPGTVISSL